MVLTCSFWILLLLFLFAIFQEFAAVAFTVSSLQTTTTTRITRSRLFASSRRRNDDEMFWPQHSTPNHDDNDQDDENDYDNELSAVYDSILKVHCTHTEPDYLIPWQKTHQSTSTSSGFCIKDKLIMTNAHSVEYASMVQVQRRGDERKFQAVAKIICNECDLALLCVEDEEFWNDLEPLEFGPLPALQDEVEVLGYPTGGDSLSVTQGVVSRIEAQEYSQASTHLLAIQIDAAINAGNSGGPVVNEDLQVIGVAFQGLDDAQNIGYVVPVTVALHVLYDLERNGKYTGFCSLGISLSRLENDAFRKSLGMGNLSGIHVKEIAPTAASKGILLPNDVILQVDGIEVANDGKIPFRPGERVSLSCYIQTKFLGDSVNMKLLRDGQQIQLDVPVSIVPRLVPAHWDNQPPPYLVMSGLVFTALSIPYLHASEAWDSYISDSLSYLLGKWDDKMPLDGDQVVVLSQVLAHPENLGYDRLSDLHLKIFNGQAVRSLRHLNSLIEDCDEEFIRLELEPDHRILVLERCNIDRVTNDICKEHSIQRSRFLHDDEEEKEESSLAEHMVKKATVTDGH